MSRIVEATGDIFSAPPNSVLLRIYLFYTESTVVYACLRMA